MVKLNNVEWHKMFVFPFFIDLLFYLLILNNISLKILKSNPKVYTIKM